MFGLVACVRSFLVAWWLVVAFSFPCVACGVALVPPWQDVTVYRTRSELGKAEKARKGCKPFNRVKLWQAVKPIKCRYKADKESKPRNASERVKPYNII